MEFFLEMIFTAVISLLFSFLVAKLVSLAMGGNDQTSDQADKPEISVGDGFLTEELRFGMKMDVRVIESERKFRIVDQNVDLYEIGDDRVAELVEEATEPGKFSGEGEELAEAESPAAFSPENVVVKEVIVRGQEEKSGATDAEPEELIVRTTEPESPAAFSPENVIAKEMVVRGQEEKSGETAAKPENLIVRTTEAESSTYMSPENVATEETTIQRQEERTESTEERGSGCVETEESGDVLSTETEEVKVEESNTLSMEASKGTEELSIEEDDDDWEGIEKTELEKTFAATAKFLEESGKSEEIGVEAKMKLYGLYKIATEGSCRETQPMAVMVSARAKWNAWQILGNMSQEEAMEQYLALISTEIPGLMNIGHTEGKMRETETSDPTTLDTSAVASGKNVSGER